MLKAGAAAAELVEASARRKRTRARGARVMSQPALRAAALLAATAATTTAAPATTTMETAMTCKSNQKDRIPTHLRPAEAAQAQNRIESHIASQHMPIKALNQFNTEWCIKARVLKKADMRNYRNDKGEGCILNLDLIDREGTMI